ncbi:TerB family tellurite resistance protein [Parvularcula sp. ZS-1/3]|uniref:TerB family tellurite resistance protein n=1 Tax=Parvularcula mediterranea TaxID=2732508 RepID=A0A7Y3RJD7_9PROT|nr:TerB family tellurite resistance protein [Parvularcula mediterranea]NNU15154.1 TerB family tellurite resistance protein [Parvularcula mediterranea]
MLDRLFKNFRKEEAPTKDENALPRAVAALLVEAARADEEYTDDERDLIVKLLRGEFDLTEEEAVELRREAEEAQAAANDLYGFSRVVKEELDREGKMQLIEAMWRVVLTDAERDPHEEMVIRRLVGLIHLEDRDSTEARRRAEK